MSVLRQTTTQSKPVPAAPSKLSLWFSIASWLPKYNWGKYLTADIIAAVSVAALLIPKSMGYATVAGVPVQIGLYVAPLSDRYGNAMAKLAQSGKAQAETQSVPELPTRTQEAPASAT